MDKSRVESTIFFIEKISFSLKLFSGHFYGQSFIKTVRGPYTLLLLSHIQSKQKNEKKNTLDNINLTVKIKNNEIVHSRIAGERFCPNVMFQFGNSKSLYLRTSNHK